MAERLKIDGNFLLVFEDGNPSIEYIRTQRVDVTPRYSEDDFVSFFINGAQQGYNKTSFNCTTIINDTTGFAFVSVAALKTFLSSNLGSGNSGLVSAAWGDIIGTLSSQIDLQIALDSKENTLVSGSNIKTINGSTILGSGNLTIGGGALVKTEFAEISVDTTTTATIAAPSSLLSIAITPDSASNKFIVSFTASGDLNSNPDGQISFQLFYGLTGSLTKRRSTYIFHDSSAKEAGSCALSMRLDALGSGEHTIEIKWGRTTSTARIRPVTDPNYDHATLIIQEVKA
jgi:hypothetical protein